MTAGTTAEATGGTTAEATTAELLLLDFDGVIADSVNECMALTWYAGTEPSHQLLDEQFAAVPEDFVQRFHTLRPYARTLEDFLVVKQAPTPEAVVTQHDFDQLKNSTSVADQTEFALIATELRGFWRATQRNRWLAAHTVFTGIAETLARYAGNVFVITAKDAQSSIEILEHFDLARYVAAVAGDVSNKGLAAQCLCLGRGVDPSRALFVDDNLTNVSQVQAAGIPSRWATWGWTTPEHRRRADQLDLLAIGLPDLAAL